MFISYFLLIAFIFAVGRCGPVRGRPTLLQRRQSSEYLNLTRPDTIVHQYPPGTWVENLAVRPNGKLLPSTLTSPILNQLDSTTGQLELVYDFSNSGTGMEGITVFRDDLFVLTIDVCTTAGCSNFSSWTIDFPDPTSSQAIVTKVVDWPDTALLLNGMVTLDAERGLVLVADSFVGGVWLLDINEKTVELVIKDGSMVAPTGSSTPTGINGLRYRSGEIFFTNYAAGTLNRMPVDAVTGMQKGRSTVIASGLPLPDDFELDPETRYAYVAGGSANEILKVPIDGGPISIVAGVPGPTSVRRGPRDKTGRDVLYAVGNGGLAAFLSGDPTLGGSVVRLGIKDS